MKASVATVLIAGASAHGSMTYPKPRNAYSSPATNPSSGGDKSCTGDACYWYHVGCHIGCSSCTLEGKDLYPGPHCTAEQGLMEPTNNDPQFRTWDPHGQSECGDFTKYNPWRAPGKAPVMDPCGIASGFANPSSYVEVPKGYQGGQKGSEVLPEAPPAYWKAGGTAQVGWGLSAQHGGGYSYRLCPKGSQVTEKCFQSNTLRFAAANSTIHFDDGSHADIEIPTTTYTAPDGTEWRTNPIPGCACDNGITCGGKEFLDKKPKHHVHAAEYSQGNCAGQYPKSTVYANHGSPTSDCPRGTMFESGFDQFTQGFLVGSGNEFSVMDNVQVPNTPGDYVLSWRWDCEETDQVWNSCADIVISSGPIPAPTPAPPAPSPSPGKGDYLCFANKCYEKPGYGTMDQATCEKTCSDSVFANVVV